VLVGDENAFNLKPVFIIGGMIPARVNVGNFVGRWNSFFYTRVNLGNCDVGKFV